MNSAARMPPVSLDEALAVGVNALAGRRVAATGRFLEQHIVYIDNRGYRGQAGFHVLTPFIAEGVDRPVLVLRGWAPQDPAQRARLPNVAATVCPVRIEALVQPYLEQALELAPSAPPGPDDRLWQNATIAQVARWSSLPLAPMLLRQLSEERAGSDGASITSPRVGSTVDGGVTLIRDWPSPGAGVDKHRAYAFQWYSMAVLIAGLWVVLTWRRRRSRT